MLLEINLIVMHGAGAVCLELQIARFSRLNVDDVAPVAVFSPVCTGFRGRRARNNDHTHEILTLSPKSAVFPRLAYASSTRAAPFCRTAPFGAYCTFVANVRNARFQIRWREYRNARRVADSILERFFLLSQTDLLLRLLALEGFCEFFVLPFAVAPSFSVALCQCLRRDHAVKDRLRPCQQNDVAVLVPRLIIAPCGLCMLEPRSKFQVPPLVGAVGVASLQGKKRTSADVLRAGRGCARSQTLRDAPSCRP